VDLDRRLRKRLYDEIVAYGRLSPNGEIAAALGVGVEEIEQSLVRLEAMHALALAREAGTRGCCIRSRPRPRAFR
jgi:hypothetical protein